MKYRPRAIEVEAWQVGSGDMPKWVRWTSLMHNNVNHGAWVVRPAYLTGQIYFLDAEFREKLEQVEE